MKIDLLGPAQYPSPIAHTVDERARIPANIIRLAGRKPAFSPEERRHLSQQVEARPDATLGELRDGSGKAVSLVCILRTLRQLGFTRKKYLYVRTNSDLHT